MVFDKRPAGFRDPSPSRTQGFLSYHISVDVVGKLPVGMGRLDFGGYTDNLLWFLGGKTTWMGVGKRDSGTVFVYLTGRAVSMSTLQQFAKSMHPLSR